jgi:hypothetical protein
MVWYMEVEFACVGELQQERDRLAEALKPFAAAGHLAPKAEPDADGIIRVPDGTPIITLGNSPGPYAQLNYGHLRAAARLLPDARPQEEST